MIRQKMNLSVALRAESLNSVCYRSTLGGMGLVQLPRRTLLSSISPLLLHCPVARGIRRHHG